MWTNDQLRLLINERKSRNIEYHNIVGSSRVDFWNEIANKINEEFRTNYTGHQCKDKFRNLVNSHNVSIIFFAITKYLYTCTEISHYDYIPNNFPIILVIMSVCGWK